jgi:MOSC domain-containing protein YiiM
MRHRGRLPQEAALPNLRQVHLIAAELCDDLRAAGFDVEPGDLGENVTTRGVTLAELPVGTTLRLGDRALVALTGVRTPCVQIDRFGPGLLETVRHGGGAGVMAVVVSGGVVRAGDLVTPGLPAPPHEPRGRV